MSQRAIFAFVDLPSGSNVLAEPSKVLMRWYVDMPKIIDQPPIGIGTQPAFALCEGLFLEDSEIVSSGFQEAVNVMLGFLLVLIKDSPQCNQ